MNAQEIVPIVVTNLTSPPALAFALGLVAALLLRAQLRLPAPVYTAISMYLLLAIGIKGGVALRDAHLGDLAAPALAAVCLGVAIPFLVFRLLRWITRLGAIDRGAMAAHYGSTSLVTFTAAIALLETLKIPFEGYTVTLLTLMEIPGIIVGLVLARSHRSALAPAVTTPQHAHAHAHAGSVHASPVHAEMPPRAEAADPHQPDVDAVGPDASGDWRTVLREVVTGPSVMLLVGGLLLGAATGPSGYASIEPFFGDLFRGLLTLFLLHLGCVAGTELRRIRGTGIGFGMFALAFPFVGGSLGVLAGTATGLSVGGSALLGVLCASASYIAAPAAVSLALPKANEGLCLTASLGLTFPMNLALGIPALIALAQFLHA